MHTQDLSTLVSTYANPYSSTYTFGFSYNSVFFKALIGDRIVLLLHPMFVGVSALAMAYGTVSISRVQQISQLKKTARVPQRAKQIK